MTRIARVAEVNCRIGKDWAESMSFHIDNSRDILNDRSARSAWSAKIWNRLFTRRSPAAQLALLLTGYRLVLLLVLSILSGCATHADRVVLIRQAFYAGDFESALDQTAVEGKRNGYDADVIKLDRAMIQLADGNPRASENILREIRDRFDQLETETVTQKIASLATDDRKLPYAGEEYEKILIRVMLAISNLMYDGGDVNAYALQIAAKQQQLLQKAQEKSKEEDAEVDLATFNRQLAVGSYFRAAILESSPLDYDDVQRYRVQVANWQPDFRDAQVDLARAQTGRHSAPGNGVVYVIAFVGEGPYKEEAMETPTSTSLLIADQILSVLGEYELPPTVAPIKIPVVVRSPQQIDSVAVSEQGKLLGTTATLMDISSLAIEQNQLQRDDVLARAIARRIIKKGTIYAVKDGLEVEKSPEFDILLTIIGVAWEAAEQADTRCWSLLPDRIQVLRLELPAGSHQLDFAARLRGAHEGKSKPVTVNVVDGKTTFVLSVLPQDRVIGKVLTKIYQ